MNLQKLFPYDPRKGQVNLIDNMVQTIKNNNILLTSAPTGMGKTICAITAALNSDKKCIFVTPRKSQHKIVIDSINDIGIGSVISIIGKREMCINDNIKKSTNFYEACLNTRCPFKYKLAPRDINSHMDSFIEYCSDNGACPYYTALECAKDVDIVIANYRHIFDPIISKIFFNKLEVDMSDIVLIVDEAHNLPNMLRDIASIQISETSINRAMDETRYLITEQNIKKTNEILGTTILYKMMDSMTKQKDIIYKNDINIAWNQVNFLHEMGGLVLNRKKEDGKISPISYIQRVADFFSTWLEEDELSYVRILENYKDNLKMSIKCMEPQILSEVVYEFDSVILMSGTLEPIGYFKEVLGLTNASMKRYPPTFPIENKIVIIDDSLTTIYKSRNERTYKDYADKISLICNDVEGNVIVFFPSYKFMNEVANYINCDRIMIKESPNIIRTIHKLLESRDKLILAVERGSLAEGIDYPGNLLPTIIIVGFPYPVMSVEQKALTNYYQRKNGNGFVMASLYPTINIILQTMGRGIRSETDKCTIHLLDKRFKQYERYFK